MTDNPAYPRLVTVDVRCSLERCSKNIYRMVGYCMNCCADNLLFLITAGHDAPRSMYEATCPICGCRKAVAKRLATPDEIPDAWDDNPGLVQ